MYILLFEHLYEHLTEQLPKHHLTEGIDTHIMHGGVVVCASFPSKRRGGSPCGGVCEWLCQCLCDCLCDCLCECICVGLAAQKERFVKEYIYIYIEV